MANRLAPDSCIALLRALADGVVGIGPLKALQSFAATGAHADQRCAGAIAAQLEAGQDFAMALSLCQPQLPLAVEGILALADRQGLLDEGLSDILSCLSESSHEDESLLRLDLLQQEWESRIDSPFICQGCLERELQKIIARARTEGAGHVILQQEGERFLHQKYLAAKLVHITEAGHAKTFRSLEEQLSAAADSGTELALAGRLNTLTRLDARAYNCAGPDGFALRLEFRPWLA